jgi:hypothetical protein
VELRGAIRIGRRYRAGQDAEQIVRQLEAPPIQQTGNVIRIGRIDEDIGGSLGTRPEMDDFDDAGFFCAVFEDFCADPAIL